MAAVGCTHAGCCDCTSLPPEFTVKVTRPLARKVKAWLRSQNAAFGGLVVAVSGGPDSVALLCLLLELAPRSVSGPVIVAHLNHQLRGAESDADEAFVRELYAGLATSCGVALQLRCELIDVAGTASAAGANLEGTARRLRYDWLGRVAQEAGVAWIATGHTADDQAETVLHRLLRGTGLKGLRGIAARRLLLPGVEIIRPLLPVRRADLLAYLREIGQGFRTDSSNSDPRYTRNRIRHQLLPLLREQFNPAVESVLSRLAEQAEEAFHAEEEQARRLLSDAERPRAGLLLVFDRPILSAAPRRLVRELFRLVWEREGWLVDKMGFDGWERLAAVALGEAAGVDLPGHIQARCGERVVQIGRVL